MMRNNKSI